MLTISRDPKRFPPGMPRRDFLQIGLLGPLGVGLSALRSNPVRAASSASAGFGRAKSCIVVFLNGGPSQLDLWDMKPEAPKEIRGELLPIATRVPGIRVSELLPLTACEVDKFKIVRSVTHEASVHTTAVYTMLTGTPHSTPGADQTRITAQDHPHLGSILAKHRGWSRQLPPFVCLPTLFQAPPVEGIWPGQNAGFLGRRYDPLVIKGEKTTAQFSLPDIEMAAELTPDRVAQRRDLVARLDRSFDGLLPRSSFQAREELNDQAYNLLGAPHLARALDLTREPAHVPHRYGRHLFGQGLLLSRRLIEAGIPLVTVYWIDPTPAGDGGGEYDSHGRIFWHMRNRLVPPTDQALSALMADLAQRGLLEDTLVVVMGEFGRTPRLNAQAGRDHWPQVQSILLAGAGITGGSIYGASDRWGAFPTLDAVTPADLGQTILHLLGVPADLELHDHEGRPILASRGQVLPKLFS